MAFQASWAGGEGRGAPFEMPQASSTCATSSLEAAERRERAFDFADLFRRDEAAPHAAFWPWDSSVT